jgi:prepilin-type N-terminal cleavage/methylation domain-containing protein
MTVPHASKRRPGGFTLVELLVSMGITAIILTLLVTVTAVALDGWRASRNQVRSARQAKSALDQLTRDFESMVVRSGNNFEWLYVESHEGVGPINSPSPNSARLLFFSAATDRYNGDIDGKLDEGGDISGVGYELFYKNPITGSDVQSEENRPVFALYRQLVNPDETFDELLAEDDLDKAYGKFMGEQDRTNNFLCENIYEMSVVFLVEYTENNGDGGLVTLQQRIPVISTGGSGESVSTFSVKGNGIEADGNDGKPYSHGRIVAVDISVSVITDSAMARLQSTGITGAPRDKLLSQNTYHYAKTIIVPQP